MAVGWFRRFVGFVRIWTKIGLFCGPKAKWNTWNTRNTWNTWNTVCGCSDCFFVNISKNSVAKLRMADAVGKTNRECCLFWGWIDAIDPTDPTDPTDPMDPMDSIDWIYSTWWMDEGFGGDLPQPTLRGSTLSLWRSPRCASGFAFACMELLTMRHLWWRACDRLFPYLWAGICVWVCF